MSAPRALSTTTIVGPGMSASSRVQKGSGSGIDEDYSEVCWFYDLDATPSMPEPSAESLSPERVIASLGRGPTMWGMRHILYLVAMLGLASLLTTTSVAAPTTTATQLTTRFRAATGEKLVPSRTMSHAGHYRAYDLGVATAAKKARWGTFTVYLVTAADVQTEVNDLLADSHTGMLGQPAAGNVHWEAGVTIYGDKYWQAKRRYGQNVVLRWTSTSGQKKTDVTWKRLHTALTAATK